MKFSVVSTLAACASTTSALLAFPGAEGFGRNAVGGRGGRVYKVTNLNDSGCGSLRDAVSKPNRIVIFGTGGVINITSRIVVSKNVYIAGQTAPGGGITVYGNGISWSNADDAIVRYISVRMGKGGDSGKDAIGIAEGSNFIFDHVSVTWGRDETFSINGPVHNVTIQDTIMGQGLETHSCGGLIQSDYGISMFRNLYIDNKTRNPKVKGVNDFQNNVIYNWGSGGGYIAGGDSAGQSFVNIINNYFIKGPSTTIEAVTRSNELFHGYVSENYVDENLNGALDGSALCLNATSCYGGMDIISEPYAYPGPAKLLEPTAAVAHVAAKVGASFPSRNSVDKRLIQELLSYGTVGELIADEQADPMGGVGEVDTGTAPKDTDGDGIPDEWEIANGLNPQDASDGMALDSSGYTNLEVWANSLVPSTYP